jgi:hypothetical protein
MENRYRVLHLPEDRSIGYLHVRNTGYPYDFHGRLRKDGGVLEDASNPGWTTVGEARGAVRVPVDHTVLLEILPEVARDLSILDNIDPDSLDAMWLGNTYVDDGQLAHLRHLTELEWVDIQNNGRITDHGIQTVRI